MCHLRGVIKEKLRVRESLTPHYGADGNSAARI